MSPQDIADNAKKKFGKVMCMDCVLKENQRIKEEKEAKLKEEETTVEE